jgi:hypothetical protein
VTCVSLCLQNSRRWLRAIHWWRDRAFDTLRSLELRDRWLEDVRSWCGLIHLLDQAVCERWSLFRIHKPYSSSRLPPLNIVRKIH